jgi:hypothetical protein
MLLLTRSNLAQRPSRLDEFASFFSIYTSTLSNKEGLDRDYAMVQVSE